MPTHLYSARMSQDVTGWDGTYDFVPSHGTKWNVLYWMCHRMGWNALFCTQFLKSVFRSIPCSVERNGMEQHDKCIILDVSQDGLERTILYLKSVFHGAGQMGWNRKTIVQENSIQHGMGHRMERDVPWTGQDIIEQHGTA